MMVIFLVGLVAMILVRTLRKDYARYGRDEEALDDIVRSLSSLLRFRNEILVMNMAGSKFMATFSARLYILSGFLPLLALDISWRQSRLLSSSSPSWEIFIQGWLNVLYAIIFARLFWNLPRSHVVGVDLCSQPSFLSTLRHRPFVASLVAAFILAKEVRNVVHCLFLVNFVVVSQKRQRVDQADTSRSWFVPSVCEQHRLHDQLHCHLLPCVSRNSIRHHGLLGFFLSHMQVVVVAIFLFVIVPLTLVGSVLGRNLAGASDNPCRVNPLPRPIPEKKWYEIIAFHHIDRDQVYGASCYCLAWWCAAVWLHLH
jgi:hypothetical protein